MLTLSLENQPPTTAQIEQERQRLTRCVKGLNRWRRACLCLVLGAAITIFAHYVPLAPSLSEQQAILLLAGLVLGLGGVGCFKGSFAEALCAVGVTLGLFLVLIGFFHMIIFGDTRIATYFVPITVLNILPIRIKIHLRVVTSKLNKLAPLNSAKQNHRCEPVLQACAQDPLCHTYAAAVSRMGRPLVVAEADMIETWVAGAEDRKKAEETLRHREIACVQLRNLGQIEG